LEHPSRFAQRYEVLVIGVVIVVAVFMFYAWKRNQEISELRGLVSRHRQSHTRLPATNNSTNYSVSSNARHRVIATHRFFDDVLVAVNLLDGGNFRRRKPQLRDLVAQLQKSSAKHSDFFWQEPAATA